MSLLLAVIFEGADNRLPFTKEQILKSFCSADEEYYLVNMGCTKVLFCRLGETKVKVTKQLTELNAKFCIDNVILTGSAFAFDQTLALNTVAVGSGTFAYDVNYFQSGGLQFAMPDVSRWYFTPSPLITALAWRAAKQLCVTYTTGTFVSADSFLPTADMQTSLVNVGVQFVDSMSATVGEFAYLNKIPFGIVKGIAGYVGVTTAEEYAAARVAANELSLRVAAKMISVTCHDTSTCPYFVPLTAEQARNFALCHGKGTFFALVEGQQAVAEVFYRVFTFGTKTIAVIANPDDRTAFFLNPAQDATLAITGETKQLKTGKTTTSAFLSGEAYSLPVDRLDLTETPDMTAEQSAYNKFMTNVLHTLPCFKFITVMTVTGAEGKILFTPRPCK